MPGKLTQIEYIIHSGISNQCPFLLTSYKGNAYQANFRKNEKESGVPKARLLGQNLKKC